MINWGILGLGRMGTAFANAIDETSNSKLIGIASNLNSSLLKNANIPILLPKTKEACNSGIVPTTSTTMALALGDAIAITIMEFRFQ